MAKRIVRTLTTRQAADLLGVPTDFVRGEIKDGRLVAAVAITRPSGRVYRRIDRGDFVTYCRKWCPRVTPSLAE